MNPEISECAQRRTGSAGGRERTMKHMHLTPLSLCRLARTQGRSPFCRGGEQAAAAKKQISHNRAKARHIDSGTSP